VNHYIGLFYVESSLQDLKDACEDLGIIPQHVEIEEGVCFFDVHLLTSDNYEDPEMYFDSLARDLSEYMNREVILEDIGEEN